MNRRAILLLCAVLSSLLATCYNQLDDSCLDWTILPPVYNSAHRTLTRGALWLLELRESDTADVILSKIETNLNIFTRTDHQKKVYANLIEITDKDAPYSDEVLYNILQVCSIMRIFPNIKVLTLIPFLMEYGKDKFGKLSKFVVKKLKQGSERNNEALQKLDELFAIILDLEDVTDEEMMLRELKSFDFAHSQFDFGKANDPLMDLETSPGREGLDIFMEYVQGLCKELFKHRRRAMQIIALADVFGYSSRRDIPKVLKLKEYNRLCLSLWRPDKMHQVENHLKYLINREN